MMHAQTHMTGSLMEALGNSAFHSTARTPRVHHNASGILKGARRGDLRSGRKWKDGCSRTDHGGYYYRYKNKNKIKIKNTREHVCSCS